MLSHSVVSNSGDPMDFGPPGSSVDGDFPGQNIGVGSLSLLQGIFPFSQPRDGTQVSHIAGDSLPSEPPGKPKNTGVGSLSLL